MFALVGGNALLMGFEIGGIRLTDDRAGAAIDHNNRGKGALIGAAVAGLGAAGYGYYADKQEAALRASMGSAGNM